MQADHSLMGRLSDAKRSVFRLQKVADLPCTDLSGEIKNGARQEIIGGGDEWGQMLSLRHLIFSV